MSRNAVPPLMAAHILAALGVGTVPDSLPLKGTPMTPDLTTGLRHGWESA